MKDCVPDCPQLEETVNITTNTLDNYISDQVFPIDNISLLNIDIQGSELECFKGAEKLLMSPALKCIYCEVSRGQVYKNGPEQADM
jgi:FkbM family methyltransferase